MYRKIHDFIIDWTKEKDSTLSLFNALTDASLKQRVTKEGRSLGKIAWHITLTCGEMLSTAGFTVDYNNDEKSIPTKAEIISSEFEKNANMVLKLVPVKWTDEDLDTEIDMYGQKWKKGIVLNALIKHLAHHRGQITVLMRQAGLKVSGVYGPSKEEWSKYGKPEQD